MKSLLCTIALAALVSAAKLPKQNEDVGSAQDWWENTVLYQIYPRSYQDSDGDGVGDIKGIISRLPHLKESGVGATWLSPIFKSPMKDFGYDVSDFLSVDPLFGTMADLEELFEKATELGIKIILDFVPNHTSDQHAWFEASIKREEPYTDYYIWRDGRESNTLPPNNWQSVFYGSAWTFNEQRGQWYLHQFDQSQPDLNFRNNAVLEEFENILTFWLGKGASGFRVDAINHMFEVEDFLDEPLSGYTDDPLSYGYTHHWYTKDLNETYEVIYSWRKLLDNWKLQYGGETKIMLTEAYTNTTSAMKYYKSDDGSQLGAHMPFNFELVEGVGDWSSPKDFKRVIDDRLNAVPKGHVTNWVLGNHDKPRYGSKFGTEMIEPLMLLIGTLPGVMVTYYGEEIGMVDFREISYADTQDPQACNGPEEFYQNNSRDPQRTPMQWDATTNAGFSSGVKPWLPLHTNYVAKNLAAQTTAVDSTYKFYKNLLQLRQQPSFSRGQYSSRILSDTIFVHVRSLAGEERYVTLVNFGNAIKLVDLRAIQTNLASYGVVVLASPNSAYAVNDNVSTSVIQVGAHDAFVLKYPAVVAPEEDAADDWWKKTIFYQIYPRSFKDSDGDGVGDIQGIISRLNHLKNAGIQATWLSPIFKSPMKDFGYDISDFKSIDPIFGSMSDIEELFWKANDLGIKIILDFVPNHSSDQHEWFQKSIKREDPYTNYYVWRDGRNNNLSPPNNWQSVFYGPAWTFNEERNQWYLHQFDASQPDLNFRNDDVIDEMKDVLRFWLQKGASGFRVDAINHMFEVADFADEPLSGYTDDPNSYGYTHHWYTKDLNETYDMIYEWRDVLDQWQNDYGGQTRIMMTEAYANSTSTMKFYRSDDGSRLGSHMPFNFVLIENLNENSTPHDFKRVIDERLAAIPDGRITNWVIGNHDKPRVGSRYGTEMVDALLTLVSTLPGVAVTYNGEEIGMLDHRDISYNDTKDPQACNGPEEYYKDNSRDPQRTPFQWDDSNYAGFSSVSSWLPVNPNYKEINLKAQEAASVSTFKFYQKLASLRQNDHFLHGSFESMVFKDSVLAYTRSLNENGAYIVVLSFSGTEQQIDLSELDKNVESKADVVVVGTKSAHSESSVVQTNNLVVGPYDAFIIKYPSSSAASATASIAVFLVAAIRLIFS